MVLVSLAVVSSCRVSFLAKGYCSTLKRALSVSNSSLKSFQWGHNKKNRKLKIPTTEWIMADPKVEEILAPLRAAVKEQVNNLNAGVNLDDKSLLLKYSP